MGINTMLYSINTLKNKRFSELLELKTKGIPGLKQKELAQYYSNIWDTLDMYRNRGENFSKADFRILKTDLEEVLDVCDHQLSFLVLNLFENKKQIKSYPLNERKQKSLDYLKGNREKFISFFNLRENTLKKLKEHGIISDKKYTALSCSN